MEYTESDTLTYKSTVIHTNLYGTSPFRNNIPLLSLLPYFFFSARSGDAARPGCGHCVWSVTIRLSGWHGSLVGMEAVPRPQTTLSSLVTALISQ